MISPYASAKVGRIRGEQRPGDRRKLHSTRWVDCAELIIANRGSERKAILVPLNEGRLLK